MVNLRMAQEPKKKKLKIYPIGGLGNQLFIFYAGLAMSTIRNSQLVVDMSLMPKYGKSHGENIANYILPGDIKIINPDPGLIRSFSTRVILNLSTVLHSATKLKNALIYISPQIGFDSQLLENKKLTRIFGYFQSYKYFELVDTLFSERIRKKRYSEEYLKLESLMEKEDFIAIHIRRGDFKLHASTVGILSINYYKSCLIQASKEFPTSSILVFTDDIEEANRLISLLPSEVNTQVITDKEISCSLETIQLMSKAKILIIANSTFSYWGGIFSGEKTEVWAPEKWFRAMGDPNELMPNRWKKINPNWESESSIQNNG